MLTHLLSDICGIVLINCCTVFCIALNVFIAWACSIFLPGTPPIEIVWVHKDREISFEDPVFKMKSDGNTHRLIIPEVLPEDTGEFVCEAYNDCGDTDTFCFLHVRGRDPQASNRGHCHRNVLGVPHVHSIAWTIHFILKFCCFFCEHAYQKKQHFWIWFRLNDIHF